jgi:hypothetical protein
LCLRVFVVKVPIWSSGNSSFDTLSNARAVLTSSNHIGEVLPGSGKPPITKNEDYKTKQGEKP